MSEQWKKVLTFGNCEIFARINNGKIVTPGLLGFRYEFLPQSEQTTEF